MLLLEINILFEIYVKLVFILHMSIDNKSYIFI